MAVGILDLISHTTRRYLSALKAQRQLGEDTFDAVNEVSCDESPALSERQKKIPLRHSSEFLSFRARKRQHDFVFRFRVLIIRPLHSS